MEFKKQGVVWCVSLNGETLSVENFIDKVRNRYPYELLTFKDLENKFVNSAKYEFSSDFVRSWSVIWYDYLQAHLYNNHLENFRKENNYSLLNGKHVKIIDKEGERFLKELSTFVKGK